MIERVDQFGRDWPLYRKPRIKLPPRQRAKTREL